LQTPRQLGHCYACYFICRVSRIEPIGATLIPRTACAGVGLCPVRPLGGDLRPEKNRHLLMPEKQNPLTREGEGARAVFGQMDGVASLRSP